MPPIRVLLGSLPAAVRNSVSHVVNGQADMELVGVAAGRSELLYAAGALRADVVVVAAGAGAPPGVATHLLDQYPDIRVLAVTTAGTALSYRLRPHFVEFACSTPVELAAAIRATEDPDT